MRALIYTCLGLAALLAAPRQSAGQGLTNLNLDSWVTRGAVEKPVNWLTTDDEVAFTDNVALGTYNFGLVKKTTDAHGGTYAAQLTTNYVAVGTQQELLTGDLFIGAKLGAYNLVYGFPVAGAPLAGKPTSMTFYYKSTAPVADSALALVYLSNTTNGSGAILGIGYKFLPPATAYTAVTLPFTYSTTNTATPDSVHIIFTSAYANLVTPGSVLQVDDITFQGVALATRAGATVQDLLTVSPNPSTGGRFVISAAAKPELAAAPLQVLDLTGRTVLRQAAQPSPSGSRDLDLSTLSAGLYLLRLDTESGTIVRQLTVK